jgi:hypothetical protein
VTDRTAPSRALQALTAAAFALPGMTAAKADEAPSITLQYGHYEEGKRDLDGQSYWALKLKPLSVDSFALRGVIPLSDVLTFKGDFLQDSWSGATPVVSLPSAAAQAQLISGASSPNYFHIDRKGTPYVVDFNDYDPATDTYKATAHPGLVHVMASASPETRRQWDGSLTREWGKGELTLGGGISDEHDYLSRFFNAGGKLNFDNKLTVLNWGASATWNRIRASIAANSAADDGNYTNQIHDYHGQPTIFGERQDYAADIGLTRILNAGALLQGDLSFTRSSGFLENPYKAVIFAFNDPDEEFDNQGLKYIPIKGSLEQRPDVRSQWAFNLRLAQHIAATDGALHLSYRFYRDSWHISSQTAEVSLEQPLGHGWLITPDVRYYSQTAAFFYAPYFMFDEPYPAHPGGPLERDKIPLNYFSSDERLSAFGALSGSLALQKSLGHGVALDLSYEYYVHKGSLKLGGGGEPSYADFHSQLFTAGLAVDLGRRQDELRSANGDIAAEHAAELFGVTPAGLLLPDLMRAGTIALSTSFTGTSFGGPVEFKGRRRVSDDELITGACGGDTFCRLKPISAGRNDVEFDLSYAFTRQLTLTLAPRYVENSLTLADVFPNFFIGPIGGPSGSGRHSTSGWGDTRLLASYDLTPTLPVHVRLGAGVSIPTGDAGLKLNGKSDFDSYSLQTGSGTWEAISALSVQNATGPLRFGMELGWIGRLGTNKFGYRLGDETRADLWAGADALPWLTISGRVHYDRQGRIHGAYEDHLQNGFEAPHEIASPDDLPANHGGSLLDVGPDLTLHATAGPFKGDSLSLEWLEPISNPNGYQLRRGGTLNAKVTIAI